MCVITSLFLCDVCPPSAEMERLYQEEMERLERERLEALERASAVQQQTLESDTALQNLDEVIMKGGE